MSRMEALANRLCGYGVLAVGVWIAYDVAMFVMS